MNRYLRLVEEVAHGTPAAGGVYADPESVSLDPPDGQALFFAGASGVDRQIAAGPYVSEGDITVALDDELSGFLFKWLLGRYTTTGTAAAGGLDTTLSALAAAGVTDIAVTAALNAAVGDKIQIGIGDLAEVHSIQAVAGTTLTLSTALRFAHAAAETVKEVVAPFTHQFARGDSPLMTPFTVGVGKELFEHVFAGCIANQLEFEIADKIITATLGLMASKDSKGALAAAVTWGEGGLFAPHDVTAALATVDESARIEGLKLTINHNADLESGRGIGSRFSRRGYRGALTVEGEMTLAFIDTTELERFWGGATGPTSGALSEFALDLGFGTALDISMPRVVYTKAGQPLDGPGRIEQTVGFRAAWDPVTSAGPVLISLTNTRAEY